MEVAKSFVADFRVAKVVKSIVADPRDMRGKPALTTEKKLPKKKIAEESAKKKPI